MRYPLAKSEQSYAEGWQCGDSAMKFARLASRAMLVEVNLTPKPGLVDRHSNGAHQDMTIGHFYRSAQAIGPWLPRFIQQGINDIAQPAERLLPRLRPLGLACENAMFSATQGVNTHKGSIFSLGLLCSAFGRLSTRPIRVDARSLCAMVAAMCRGLVARELHQGNSGQTAGQRLFTQHGLTGARGQAESGFTSVVNGSLPFYRQRLQVGDGEPNALLDTLLFLMAGNNDTNVAARGGLAGLLWLQQRAAALLAQGGVGQGLQPLRQFNADCVARNLSPGGSADLLIVTWLLAQL